MYRATVEKFYACTKSLPPLIGKFACLPPSLSPSNPFHSPPPHNAMFQLIIFYARRFFRVFYKFYRHDDENCRRILMWNFNLIHIMMANSTSHLRRSSFVGKQQHFRPITHSRLHQLHDFRFRYDICTHTAEESRRADREMGAGIFN